MEVSVGISFLKFFGPKFEIELETAGQINAETKSEFENIGINHTLHKLYLDINTAISILTPLGSFGKDISQKALLTEAILVGNVPDTYYNLQNLNESEFMEMMQ